MAVKVTRISNCDKAKHGEILNLIETASDDTVVHFLMQNEEYIVDFFDRYHYHTIKRYVDYNQGLDARLFTEAKAKQLSKLAIKPCRIAFDDIRNKDAYFSALRLAANNGICHFSNYLLYNYKEHPVDLWNRLYLNVSFCEETPAVKSLFSFPMKYASIEHTDRSYVGQHWNKKYLKSMNIILNVTSGVVAKEKDFFLRAFGKNEKEYLEILAMPFDFIRYRDCFESNGLINSWLSEYRSLSAVQISELLAILSTAENEQNVVNSVPKTDIKRILMYYGITKKGFEKNKAYYMREFELSSEK